MPRSELSSEARSEARSEAGSSSSEAGSRTEPASSTGPSNLNSPTPTPEALGGGSAGAELEEKEPAKPAAKVGAPRPPRVRVNWLIHLLFSRGETEECLRLIDSQLASCDGLCEYAVYVKGLIVREQGRVQEALELFQAATLLNPSNEDNLKQVGKCLLLLGKHRAAGEVLDEAGQQSGEGDWEVLHNKGLCLLYLGDYEGAVTSFGEANAVQRHDRTFVEMGKALLAQGKLAAALAVYLEALELSPDSAELLTTVGLLHLQQERQHEAFEFLGNSLTHDPLDARTILAAGSVIQDHGDMDVALVKYRVAAARAPDSPQLWNNVGMCFFGKQKLVAAVACLKHSLYLDPFQWITAYNLGLVHLATAQHASAFHYLSASINLHPHFAPAYAQLAVALAKLDDPDNAAAAYDKALSLAPGDAPTLLNYSAMLHNLGRRAECRAQLEKYKQAAAAAAAAAAEQGQKPGAESESALFHKLSQLYL